MIVIFMDARTNQEAHEMIDVLFEYFEDSVSPFGDDVPRVLSVDLTRHREGDWDAYVVGKHSPKPQRTSGADTYISRCPACDGIGLIANADAGFVGEIAHELLIGRKIEHVTTQYIRAGGWHFCRCKGSGMEAPHAK